MINIKLKQTTKLRQSASVMGMEVRDKRISIDIEHFKKLGGDIVTVDGKQHIVLTSILDINGLCEPQQLDVVYGTLLHHTEMCTDNSVPQGWYLTLTPFPMMNCVKLHASVNTKTGICTSVSMADPQCVNVVTSFALVDDKPEMNLVGLTDSENLVKDLIARGVYTSSKQSAFKYLCKLGEPILYEDSEYKYSFFKLEYNGLSIKVEPTATK